MAPWPGTDHAIGEGGTEHIAHLAPHRRCVHHAATQHFIIQRTKIRSDKQLAPGPTTITVKTTYAEPRPAGPLDIVLSVNDKPVASGRVAISAPLLFTANDCLDIGTCLGSPVSLDYHKRAPFPFNGTINRMHVGYD